MDLSTLPEVATYEEAQEKLEALVAEGNAIQGRLASISAEIAYYQGAAKALEPKGAES